MSQRISLLMVRVDATPFALRLTHVESLAPCHGVRTVWGAPDGVLGVVHHHGRLVAVLDTGALIQMRAAEPQCLTHVFVSIGDQRFALQVDVVDDIVEVAHDDLHTPPPGPLSPYLEAVCPLGDTLVGILEPAKILPFPLPS